MKKVTNLFTCYLLSLLIFLPLKTLAISGVDNTGDSASLENPLKQPDLIAFLQTILDIIMIFAVPLIVFMIIYAGFIFVMDRGSDTKLAEAKRALLYAVVGGVIILGANVILEVIQGTVDAFR